MKTYRTLALSALLLLGVSAAVAGDWADDARYEREANRATATPTREATPLRAATDLSRTVPVLQAWALFPPQAATRGLPKEPRGAR